MRDRTDRPRVSTVLLVGGQGTRIRHLFPAVPKPMIPVRGRPFLHWVTAYYAHHGLRHFVYAAGYKAEQVVAWCEESSMPGLRREVSFEHEPLGTGGGLLLALERCDTWTVVGNGDSLCLAGLDALLGLVEREEVDGGIVGVFSRDTSRYGRLESRANGDLVGFREKVPGEGMINAGTYLFRTDVLRALALPRRCSIEHDLFPALIASGRRIVMVPAEQEAPFLDIGTPETVAEADTFIGQHHDRFRWIGNVT
jgi:D-glycero-alpha-D-manno-heptose 1-phosphate guanylyltransferase